MSFKHYLRQRGYSKYGSKVNERTSKAFERWCNDRELKIEEITYHDLMSYLADCRERGNSQNTIVIKVDMLKKYLDYRFIVPNPARDITIPSQPRKLPHPLLNQLELDELYDSYPSYSDELFRNKIVLGLLVYQGMGSAEIRRLTMDDIYLDINFIRIRESTRFQGRSLKLTSNQKKDLSQYISEVRPRILRGRERNLLIIGQGRSENPDQLKNILQRASKSIRNENQLYRNMLQIRASVICNWLRTTNIKEVQYMAGHKNINATEIYLAGHTEDLTEYLDQHHPLK